MKDLKDLGPVLRSGHSVKLLGDVNRDLGGDNCESEGEDTQDLHVDMMSDALKIASLPFISLHCNAVTGPGVTCHEECHTD